MNHNNDVELELLISLPDVPSQPPDVKDEMAGAKKIMRLQAKLSRGDLYVRLHGQIEAESLLECLTTILGLCAEVYHLQLNFAGVKGLDDLAINALTGALRNEGTKFNRITLEGLPVWAYVELNLIGADDILGHQWVSDNNKNSVSFHRQA